MDPAMVFFEEEGGFNDRTQEKSVNGYARVHKKISFKGSHKNYGRRFQPDMG